MTREKELEDALKKCIDALYDAEGRLSLDNLSPKIPSALQQAQAVIDQDYLDVTTKHPTCLKSYNTTATVAEELSKLRYDSLSRILWYLAFYLLRDAGKDHDRGRKKLAKKLVKSSDALYKVAKKMDKVWDICKPYM